MPATEAQVAANRLNALKSTGPKTPEGKDASRGNALKHGLRSKTVLPQREAAEVERRYVAFCEELQPSGEVGMALAKQAAMMSVRSERCYDHENAVLTERVRRAEADVVLPEGCDDDEAERLRQEAGRRAMFDPSPEATLARRYEAEARGFAPKRVYTNGVLGQEKGFRVNGFLLNYTIHAYFHDIQNEKRTGHFRSH